MTTALILGVDGQDGSYLAELLLVKGLQVIGWVPENIPVQLDKIQPILPEITLSQGDLTDQESLNHCLEAYKPDLIFNLASPSSPVASWEASVEVGDVTALGVARLLEAIRTIRPKARFYQASSSELFGNPVEVPQNECTPFQPRNPYGISKLFAHWLTVRYRERYNLFAISGILYNHESPRRGLDFVTRKISYSAARIKLGLQNQLRLGNLEARRDWGYAKDYTQAMWLMMQQDTPRDYVIGTGETHSVREFCELAFEYLGLDYQDYVVQDQNYYRPEESRQLVADNRNAIELLGWRPTVKFPELVQLMVFADLRLLQNQVENNNK